MSVYTCIFVWTTSAVKHDDFLFCKSSLKVRLCLKGRWSEGTWWALFTGMENENNKTETYSCFSVSLDGLVTKKEKRLKVTKHNFEHCHFVSALSLIPWETKSEGHTNMVTQTSILLLYCLQCFESEKVWRLWKHGCEHCGFVFCVCTVCRALREKKSLKGVETWPWALPFCVCTLCSALKVEQSFKVWKTWLCEHCHFVSGPSMVPSTRLVCVVEVYIIFVSSTLSRCFVYLVGYFSSSHKVTQNIIVPCQHRFCGPSLSCWLFAWLKVWPGLTVCVHLSPATTHLAMSDTVTISQWPENGLHVNLTKFYKKGLHWVPCVFILCR